jgi:uncharacterized Zn finger protein
MAAGFRFRYRISGGSPTIQVLKAKDTETLTKGDILNLETGEVDLGATADTNLLGVCLDTGARVDSTTDVVVITDGDAVYAVDDANARLVGATLDLSGATGAQTVAASSNKEFVVVAPSSASEETLVRINVGKAFANKAQ